MIELNEKHSDLIKTLEKDSDPIKWGDAIVKLENIYIDYLCAYNTINETNQGERKKLFSALSEAVQGKLDNYKLSKGKGAGNYSISDFFIKPAQRIAKYPSLLEAIKKGEAKGKQLPDSESMFISVKSKIDEMLKRLEEEQEKANQRKNINSRHRKEFDAFLTLQAKIKLPRKANESEKQKLVEKKLVYDEISIQMKRPTNPDFASAYGAAYRKACEYGAAEQFKTATAEMLNSHDLLKKLDISKEQLEHLQNTIMASGVQASVPAQQPAKLSTKRPPPPPSRVPRTPLATNSIPPIPPPRVQSPSGTGKMSRIVKHAEEDYKQRMAKSSSPPQADVRHDFTPLNHHLNSALAHPSSQSGNVNEQERKQNLAERKPPPLPPKRRPGNS